MIEQFHQLDKCEFGVFTVHVVNLSAKGLAEGVTAEVLHFQAVFFLYLFQDYVDSLDREDCAILNTFNRMILSVSLRRISQDMW
jgi:hypothetical protein